MDNQSPKTDFSLAEGRGYMLALDFMPQPAVSISSSTSGKEAIGHNIHPSI